MSVHYNNSSSRTGFGAWLKKCADAGSPVGIVYSLNGNIKPDIVANSPTTKIIYRRQTDAFNRLPDNFFNDDPVQSATNWLSVTKDPADQQRTQIQNWALNPADYYDPLNEPAPGTIAQAEYLNTWMTTALNIAHQNGFKLALFSFPFGSPDYGLWQYLLPSLRLAKQYGGILSLHTYTENGSLLQYDSSGAFTQLTLDTTLRHRKIYAMLPDDAKLPLAFTEASPNNGYGTGMAGGEWVNDMGKYDTELFKDSYVQAICGFQLGGSESNLVESIGIYGDYIAAHPTPVTPVTPPEESVSGTTVPPEATIIDSLGHVWSLGAISFHGRQLLKDGIQFAGGQGLLLLYYNGRVYTKNDMNQWYLATNMPWQSIPSDPRLKPGVQGIDVSHYQSNINWSSVQLAGVKFAFIKATESNNYIDTKFAQNWRDAKSAGIKRGVYHFYRFSATPSSQAQWLIQALAQVQNDYGELPIVVDVEDTLTDANASDLLEFITIVQSQTGRHVCIYTARWYWNSTRFGVSVTWAKNFDLWTASYTSTPLIPSDWLNVGYKFWQYTNSGVLSGISGNVDLDVFNGSQEEFDIYLTMIAIPIQPPTPTINTRFGLGHGTQNEIPQSHVDIYGKAFANDSYPAFKILTLPDSSEMSASVARIKSKTPNAFIMARIFFSVADTKFTPQQFVDYSNNGTSAAYASGVRDFEVFNEPNIEGMNINWANGADFGNWLKSAIAILKARYPDARWWWPGLSPNAMSPQFISDAMSTGVGSLLYGYAFHSYWQSESGGLYNMVDDSGGLAWRKEWLRLPTSEQSKPICISEFSNNSPSVAPMTKGAQYKRYRTLLQQSGVHSAFSFVLYWGYDNNHENWCNLNGSSTGIVEGYLS